jgi:AcrR family transcriptional regulator
MPADDQQRTPDAATRILQESARLFADRGAAHFNLQEVAEAAGVSKGLIHYHYHDRDTLLARLIEMLSAGVVARQRRAMTAATPDTAVDDLWTWLRGELRRGHLRVLQELAQEPGALVRGAVLAAAHQRRDGTTDAVARLFDLLGLRPRVPPTLLAAVVVAFHDGLVLHASIAPEQDPRVAFDVFWLGMLELAD